jgi:hypothetical protein
MHQTLGLNGMNGPDLKKGVADSVGSDVRELQRSLVHVVAALTGCAWRGCVAVQLVESITQLFLELKGAIIPTSRGWVTDVHPAGM